MSPSFLLDLTDEDLCTCGSGKKWRRCHGLSDIAMPPLNETDVDPVLLALGERVLATLKDAIESVSVPEIDDSNVEDVFRKRTLLYFAQKAYRSTLAGMTLIRLGADDAGVHAQTRSALRVGCVSVLLHS